jgi:hypothetical protein
VQFALLICFDCGFGSDPMGALIVQHKVHEMIPALQLQQHEIYDTSTSSESSESVDQKVENTGNSALEIKL